MTIQLAFERWAPPNDEPHVALAKVESPCHMPVNPILLILNDLLYGPKTM